MKQYIALDLVLIPSKEWIDILVDSNQSLPNTVLKLGKQHSIPHLSIGMCRVEENAIDQLISKLKVYLEILDLSELSSLKITSLYQHNINTIGWNLELNNSLIGLHHSICALMKRYHFNQMEKENNTDFCVINKNMPFSGVEYLNTFFDENSGKNYQPHITLGQGNNKMENNLEGKTIDFDRLALYHMGTGCTCEKELMSLPLNNNY
ncbi:hypothetical protein [Flammeovirga pacifica]|uniref:2'-5' RNA ligase n=1 Tax=Flammeovirga pacifica TaxID=915059 RepID=A0A1S1Z2H0_FLAPC|nr:hypothetical protein [Flammeovirga pacifica]OHX67427.1 hypothetical protein NH26_14285 [Flammeovirga pacifica]